MLSAALLCCMGLHRHTGSSDGIVNFPDGTMLEKSHLIVPTVNDCQPGGECSFAPFLLQGYFANVNYSCWVNQEGGKYKYTGIAFECYPLSDTTIQVLFFNNSGQDIPAGTEFSLSYSAFGICGDRICSSVRP